MAAGIIHALEIPGQIAGAAWLTARFLPGRRCRTGLVSLITEGIVVVLAGLALTARVPRPRRVPVRSR